VVDQPVNFWNQVIGELKLIYAIGFEAEQRLFAPV
jgi:hypothetical protein